MQWKCAGLTSSLPEMSVEAVSNFQCIAIGFTGISQPCSLNSPKWSGSSADINVEDLKDLKAHEDCLPDFIAFDITASTRTSWSETITCPQVKWQTLPATATTDAAVCPFGHTQAPHGQAYAILQGVLHAWFGRRTASFRSTTGAIA